MWTRLLIFGAAFVAVALAAEPSTRPKTCVAGTQYAKDCNTCTCGTTPKDDKCSKLDCNRAKQSTTPRTPNPNRPGICPTKVAPRPGIDDCSKRNQTANCKVDKDCPGAKKCCQNGCSINLCRNAIYNYTT